MFVVMNPWESTPPKPYRCSSNGLPAQEQTTVVGFSNPLIDRMRRVSHEHFRESHTNMQARLPHQPRRHAGITNLTANFNRLSNGVNHERMQVRGGCDAFD